MEFYKYLLILLSVTCSGFTFLGDGYRYIPNDSFQAGERYDYRIKFGFVNIGVASVNVSSRIYSVNNRPTYRINVFGRTSGITDIFKIRNSYISYVDTSAIIPHQFVYSAREGDFKRDQSIYFNQLRDKAVLVEGADKKSFNLPKYCQDVVSGYYYLRTLPFERMRNGEIVEIPLFFADEIYTMKVKYNGKTRITTKFGKIDVFEINPILPPNKLFDGPGAIKVYVSDDRNRVPVEIFVDFKIGSASMELRSFKNQKYDFNWK